VKTAKKTARKGWPTYISMSPNGGPPARDRRTSAPHIEGRERRPAKKKIKKKKEERGGGLAPALKRKGTLKGKSILGRKTSLKGRRNFNGKPKFCAEGRKWDREGGGTLSSWEEKTRRGKKRASTSSGAEGKDRGR